MTILCSYAYKSRLQGMYVAHRRVISMACLLHAIIPTHSGIYIANNDPSRYSTEIKKKRVEKTDIQNTPTAVLSIDASGNYQLQPAAY